MPSSTVGYIGLGNAGYPIAACLGKAGYSLVIQDADPSREKNFTDEYSKCKVASTEGDEFKDCDILITTVNPPYNDTGFAAEHIVTIESRVG